MAPEYTFHGQFSSKTSIFNFGVLVLEVVSGKKANSFRNGENVEALLSFVSKNKSCLSFSLKPIIMLKLYLLNMSNSCRLGKIGTKEQQKM